MSLRLQFDALLKHCWRIGAERLATGHYARVEMSREGTAQLLRAVDRDKDQTYFLASVVSVDDAAAMSVSEAWLF